MSSTFYGRYELLRKIAAGGMAEIYLARHWGEGGFFRDVVIKRLFTNLAEHPTTLRMFQTEARLLAHLAHPNIPQVFDLGFAEGTWFLTMEYVDGMNVADVWRKGVRARQVMPLHVTLGIVLQVCEALHHAHEASDKAGRPLRIVHRDVTPQNIMLTRDGVAKLMDFGVAKTDARADTEAGTVKGTFSYMAPEQVRGRGVDRRADVFALGVILYELTTGARLFRGTDVQVMTQIVEQDAPAPSTRMPEYPADLEEIVLAALRRDSRARIASAADLALHLEHLAMRHGLIVGPRAIAAYLAEIEPSSPVAEEEVALVPPSTADLAPPSVDAPPSAESAREDAVYFTEGGLEESAEMPLAEELLEDVELLADDDSERPSALSVVPAPLAGFEEAEGTENGPVVVLDKPRAKAEEEPEDDYLAELGRRLDLESGDG
ncbi:MAG: protein kinase [Sandaracinus sp.]|nr:protein kinase [Sandaracinus sp.]